jgi:Group 4 capsule polysaccharide lipoprotein gfcB, YjbF
MGTGVAVMLAARLMPGAIVLSLLAACGNDDNVEFRGPPLVATAGAMVMDTLAERRKGQAGKAQPAKEKKGPTRASLEKDGKPVLWIKAPGRGEAFVKSVQSRDAVDVWRMRGDVTFALRNGVLIQTRGLGPDLMSSVAPSVGQLLTDGGQHKREYFFLGANDQPTRRTYDCAVTVVGSTTIEILGKSHKVTRTTEECTRPQSGKVTNEFWIEGNTVRKSRQWISGGAGYAEFERVVDRGARED